MTFSSANKKPPHGQWFAVCPFHRLSTKTGCTKSLSLRSANDAHTALRLMKLWCLQAALFTYKRDHSQVKPHLLCKDPLALDDQLLEARALELPPVPAVVHTDGHGLRLHV